EAKEDYGRIRRLWGRIIKVPGLAQHRSYEMSDPQQLFQTVREFCLSHPLTYEKLSHGAPAFFIEKGGGFATLWDNQHNDANVALLVAAPPGIQEALVGSDPKV